MRPYLRTARARAVLARIKRNARSRKYKRSTIKGNKPGGFRNNGRTGTRNYISRKRVARHPVSKARKRFRKAVKKVLGADKETHFIRLDPARLDDPRPCFNLQFLNGCGYNVQVLRPAGTQDVLLPIPGGGESSFVAQEYYSMGLRYNIRITRTAGEDAQANNTVLGYMLYSIRKNGEQPNVTTQATGLGFFPANGKVNVGAIAAAEHNNTRAKTERNALFHRYVGTSGLETTAINQPYTYLPGPPEKVQGWPPGVNPWVDGALDARVNVIQKGILMNPLYGVTNDSKVDTSFKSLWIKTGRRIDNREHSTNDRQLDMLRSTYLAIWCYNPGLIMTAALPIYLSVEVIHYFKDV